MGHPKLGLPKGNEVLPNPMPTGNSGYGVPPFVAPCETGWDFAFEGYKRRGGRGYHLCRDR